MEVWPRGAGLVQMAMNGLADLALDHLLVFMFSEGNIETGFASSRMQSFPEALKGLSSAEREALSASAARVLARFDMPPDEHGYKPEINAAEREFLEALASGELYEQWCR